MNAQEEFRVFMTRLILNTLNTLKDLPITKFRKLVAYICKDLTTENEEALNRIFSSIPEVQDNLRLAWEEASVRFQKEYEDPVFGPDGNKRTDPKEKKNVKARNKYRKDKVLEAKKAKKAYDRFLERIPKLKEIQQSIGG